MRDFVAAPGPTATSMAHAIEMVAGMAWLVPSTRARTALKSRLVCFTEPAVHRGARAGRAT